MRTLSSDCEASIGKRSDYDATAAIGGRCSEDTSASYLIEAGHRADAESMMRWAGGNDNVVLGVDSTRIVRPLFQEADSGLIPTSTLQLRFSRCPEHICVDLIRAWHSRLPRIGNSHFRVCYAGEAYDRYYAVAAWSNPVARLLPQTTWLELRRFAIAGDAPKNTASRMLGWMRRDIHKRFPEVERLISYQDLDAHAGTIYKAAGWIPARNYQSRPARWSISRKRARVSTHNPQAPRMRWELKIR